MRASRQDCESGVPVTWHAPVPLPRWIGYRQKLVLRALRKGPVDSIADAAVRCCQLTRRDEMDASYYSSIAKCMARLERRGLVRMTQPRGSNLSMTRCALTAEGRRMAVGAEQAHLAERWPPK